MPHIIAYIIYYVKHLLRQPLEDGQVTIARAAMSLTHTTTLG